MVTPVSLKDPKLTTDIDLEFERSCNCHCCHSYTVFGSLSPFKRQKTGSDSRGRTWSLWTNKSEKKLSPNISPVSPVSPDSPVSEEKNNK